MELYITFVQTLILVMLLWIAVTLAVAIKVLRTLRSALTLKAIERKIKSFDKDHTPKVIKMMAIRVVGYMAIRYALKKVK